MKPDTKIINHFGDDEFGDNDPENMSLRAVITVMLTISN